jgi:cobalt/nickel transport system permease protein
MQHDFLDRFSRMDSPIHRLPAGCKLATALLVSIAIVTTPRQYWPGLAGVAVGLLVVAALSRIPWTFLLRRLIFLEPFVLGATGLAIFQPHGWVIFATLVAKSTLCLLTMVLLSNTTPFAELLEVLRRCRVPGLLITTLALMYRYLFVLVDESQRMSRARASRTFTRNPLGRWRMLSTVVGQLFVRASQRAERIYAAMCARGWK